MPKKIDNPLDKRLIAMQTRLSPSERDMIISAMKLSNIATAGAFLRKASLDISKQIIKKNNQ